MSDAAVCRHCHSPNIASVDRYEGTCVGAVVTEGDALEFEPGGYTEIAWDSCEQVGWCCTDCGETVLAPDSILGATDSDKLAAYVKTSLHVLTVPAVRSAV